MRSPRRSSLACHFECLINIVVRHFSDEIMCVYVYRHEGVHIGITRLTS